MITRLVNRCIGCKQTKKLSSDRELCLDCRHKRDMASQRRRRALKAGLLVTKTEGHFKIDAPLKRPCEHCGREFQPRRTTARFCSTKCRVYAARAKSDEAGPIVHELEIEPRRVEKMTAYDLAKFKQFRRTTKSALENLRLMMKGSGSNGFVNEFVHHSALVDLDSFGKELGYLSKLAESGALDDFCQQAKTLWEQATQLAGNPANAYSTQAVLHKVVLIERLVTSLHKTGVASTKPVPRARSK